MTNTYDPNGTSGANPIGCALSWFGGLLKGGTPRYDAPVMTPAPTPVPIPAVPTSAPVVRIRGVAVQRGTIESGGVTCDGAIVAITLVVDDATAAGLVMQAIEDGAVFRVATIAPCG